MSRVLLISLCLTSSVLAQDIKTPNFISGSPSITRDILVACEHARIRSAKYWTGEELETWKNPCIVYWQDDVEVGSSRGILRRSSEYPEAQMHSLHLIGSDRDVLFKETIPHEIDHAVRASLTDDIRIPRCLDEGAAVVMEGNSDTAVTRRIYRESFKRLVSPRDAWAMWLEATEYPTDPDLNSAFYGFSESVVYYLLITHGKDKLLALMDTYPRPTQYWESIIGETHEETREKWVAWYQTGSVIKEQTLVDSSNKTRVVSKPVLKDVVIFSFYDDQCLPCARLSADIKKGVFKDYKVHIYKMDMYANKWDNIDGRVAYNDFRSNVAKGNITFPVIWVYGTNEYKQGWGPNQPNSILGWLAHVINNITKLSIGRPVFPEPNQAPPPPPEPKLVMPKDKVKDETVKVEVAEVNKEKDEIVEPIEEPAEELDPSNVTIVVLAAAQDVGLAKGAARKIVLKAITGPIKRRVSEVLGDKAQIELISERLDPDKYSKVVNAAEILPSNIEVLVLVKSQSLGIKGLVVGKVESILKDKIPEKVPIDVIFERVHRSYYEGVLTAIYSRGSDRYSRDDVSETEDTTDGESEEVSEAVTSSLTKDEVKAAVLEGLKSHKPIVVSEDSSENDEESKGFLHTIVALISTLIGLSGGDKGTHGIRERMAHGVVSQLKKRLAA